MQATRWRLSLARGVAEWIYRGKVNGKEEARREDRERSSSDPFSLALQRNADVGEKKRTTEKLKWTPTGVRAAWRGGISTDERCTTFGIVNSVAPSVFGRKFLTSATRCWQKTQNFPLSAKIFIIFASAINSWNGKGGV